MIPSIRKAITAMVLITGSALGATVTIETVMTRIGVTNNPPGVPGRPAPFVFRGDNPIPSPAINDSGDIVFRARSAASFDTNNGTAFGIYAKRVGFPLTVLVDTTEVSPGVPTFPVPGRPANNRFSTSNFRAPIMNNAGDVVFQALFTSPGTTPSSGSGIYAMKVTGGPIVKLIDTFDPVPGYPTATFNTFHPGLGTVALTTVLNDSGQVAFWGQFQIPGNPTQRTGLFGTTVAGGTAIRLADSVGASGPVSVPVGSNGFFNEVRYVPAINNFGTVAFSASMPGGIVNRGGIYVVPVTGGPITTVAIQGQPVPSRPGDTFSGSFEPGGHNVDINDSGVILFQNLYRAFSSPQEAGNYAATPSGAGYIHTRIYDTQSGSGISIPTEPPGTFEPPVAEFSGIQTPGINEDGIVAPFAFIFPGSPTPNQQGIYYTDTDGNPMGLVANLLTPPPGQPAPVGGFPRFSGLQQSNGGRGAINDLGNVSFVAVGNVSASVGFRGLYFYDVCTPELVRISDSTISTAQLGGFVVNGYDIYQAEATSGMYRSINNLNDVAFAAQFSNFDYGLYIAHITTGAGGQLSITCPADVSVQCPANTDPSAAGTATATGCGTITVSHSDSTTPGCGASYSITRTWSATNGSTTASCGQTIDVVDTTGPVLSGAPGNATAQCDALPPAATVTALDACQGTLLVSLTETQVPGSCPGTYVLTRTWTATDGCGNSTSTSQDVAVMDTLDPLLVGVPADVSVECDAVPDPAMVTASDTCDTDIPVTFTPSRTNGSCLDEYTLTRSWTAVDDCLNDVTAVQFVSVDDTKPPTITCPAHTLLECPADTGTAANGTATATDNCAAPSVGSNDTTVLGCGTSRTVTRTWIAADECSNSSSCTQTVAVVDTTAPTLTVDTTPITVTDTDCSGSEIVPLPLSAANDACDGSRAVTHDAPASLPTGTTTVTYSASDACGNTANATLPVTVLYGANIDIEAARHSVGSGSHPGSSKTPLVDIVVCAYDKADGSCSRTVCGGISHQHYQCILDNCAPISCCTTDSSGECTINLPPGDYIVVSGDATKTTLPDPLGVSASDLVCGETKQKHLQQIVRADGSKKPAKTTRLTGSELLIIEPEFVVWDDTEQLYPFVFETIGDWTVTATVAPPEGFIADHEALSAAVADEIEAVQFTITEVGSDLVPTQTVFHAVHNGTVRTVHSNVGILLTPEYARSRGFEVEQLQSQGLIVQSAGRLAPAKPARRPSRR